MNIGISELQISTNRMLKKLGLGEISLNAVAKKICFEHRSEGLKGKLIVECSDELEAETIDFFEKALNRFFECPFKVVLKNEALSPAQELVLRWPNVLRILNGSFSYVTDKVYVKAVGERKASVYVPNEFVYRKIKKNKGLLKDAILEVINEEIEVDCEIDTTAKMAMETTHSKERSIPVEVEPLAKKAVKPVKKTASGKENTGRRIKTAPVSINSIKFDDSVELCGGTHANNTGQIGFFKILSESSVAAGIRRIEAITGEKVVEYVFEQINELNEIKSLLKNPKKPVESVQNLIEDVTKLNKQMEEIVNQQAQSIKKQLKEQVETIHGIHFIGSKVGLNSSSAIKDIAFQLKNEIDNLVLAIGAEINGKANLSIMISENLVKEKSWNASQMIRDVAKEIQGGGGGQPFYATAGGKNPAGLEAAIQKVKSMIS